MPAPRPSSDDGDSQLRAILDELAAGRLLVDEALVRVKRLRRTSGAAVDFSMPTKRVGRRIALVVGVVLTIVGVVFGLVGFATATRSIRFARGAERVEGTVERLVRRNKSSKPVVSYVVAGRRLEVEGKVATSPPAWDVGDKVGVLYMPDDPTDAQIDGFIERWLLAVIFGGIGAAIGFVGAAILVTMLIGSLLNPAIPAQSTV